MQEGSGATQPCLLLWNKIGMLAWKHSECGVQQAEGDESSLYFVHVSMLS